MSEITVSCPSCTARLKLPDASFVGKRARCPRCSERFVVELPAAVPAAAPAPALEALEELPVLPAAPMQGQAARWVPDDAPAVVAAAAPVQPAVTAPAASALPQFDLAVAPVADEGDTSSSTVERLVRTR